MTRRILIVLALFTGLALLQSPLGPVARHATLTHAAPIARP